MKDHRGVAFSTALLGRHAGEARRVEQRRVEEANARAINAQPWAPPPGMVKRQCPECRYFFAALSTEPEAVLLCPDCAAAGTKSAATAIEKGQGSR